jgi:hypothetical protein
LENRRDFSRIAIPAPPEYLQRVVKEVKQRLSNVAIGVLNPMDLTETYDLLVRNRHSLSDIQQLPLWHLRQAPWVMFEAPNEGERPLIEDKHFLAAYFSSLKERAATRAILTLTTAFLYYYPHESAYFDFLRLGILRLLKEPKSVRAAAFLQRGIQFRLFEANGPAHCASLIDQNDNDLEKIFTDAGLTGQLSQKGFSVVIASRILKNLKKKLHDQEISKKQLDKLLNYYKGDTLTGQSFRFPALRAQLAESLLLGFLDSNPTEEIKESVKQYLLSQYADPRLHQGKWHGVSDAARSVMMRWLVENTLEDFFRLIAFTLAQDSTADRQWLYRQAFWSSYLYSGHISDAWVVLGSSLQESSSEFFKDRNSSYAKLHKGNGTKDDHACLIMKIGDFIIAEWSHMGQYRLWNESNKSAPKLYQSKYFRYNLITKPEFYGSHVGAKNGRWQETLSTHIADWTGIQMNSADYMPQ